MTFFFCFLFEPFKVYVPEHKINYFLICLIHSLTPAILLIAFSFFKVPLQVKEYWNVKMEIFFIVLFFLFVGVSQFLIRDFIYDNPNNWSWYYFYEEIKNTFLVGTLFLFILVPLNFNRLQRINKKEIAALNFTKTKVVYKNLSFYVEDLLFIKSDGNYVEMYFKDGIKKIEWFTIKSLEKALKEYSCFIKTHRSYLININYVVTFTGNAQGYKLQLKGYTEKIPVSRNMVVAFREKMSSK